MLSACYIRQPFVSFSLTHLHSWHSLSHECFQRHKNGMSERMIGANEFDAKYCNQDTNLVHLS